MKLSRLSGRKTNDYLRRKGNVWKGNTMTIRYLTKPPMGKDSGLYVGTAASVKLDKSAVKRNRMRRRCREALRTHLKSLQKVSSMQLLITPKKASLDCDFSEILRDIQKFADSHL